jgi:hypothetical protein
MLLKSDVFNTHENMMLLKSDVFILLRNNGPNMDNMEDDNA